MRILHRGVRVFHPLHAKVGLMDQLFRLDTGDGTTFTMPYAYIVSVTVSHHVVKIETNTGTFHIIESYDQQQVDDQIRSWNHYIGSV